jgi:hypothetical protein
MCERKERAQYATKFFLLAEADSLIIQNISLGAR